MLQTVMATQKCCASCEYWRGNRSLQPNAQGRAFTVKDFSAVKTTGICECGKSTHAGRERPANSVTCNQYLKWQALK